MTYRTGDAGDPVIINTDYSFRTNWADLAQSLADTQSRLPRIWQQESTRANADLYDQGLLPGILIAGLPGKVDVRERQQERMQDRHQDRQQDRHQGRQQDRHQEGHPERHQESLT